MKSFLTLLVLTATHTFAQDHLKSGVYTLGGSMSYGIHSTRTMFSGGFGVNETEIQHSEFTFSPKASQFVVDNLEISLGFGYASSLPKIKKAPPGYFVSKYFSWFASLGTRYYHPLTSSEALFVGGSGFVTWTKNDFPWDVGKFSTPYWQYELEAGLDILLSDHISLEPGIRYHFMDQHSNLASEDLKFQVGVRYFFYSH